MSACLHVCCVVQTQARCVCRASAPPRRVLRRNWNNRAAASFPAALNHHWTRPGAVHPATTGPVTAHKHSRTHSHFPAHTWHTSSSVTAETLDQVGVGCLNPCPLSCWPGVPCQHSGRFPAACRQVPCQHSGQLPATQHHRGHRSHACSLPATAACSAGGGVYRGWAPQQPPADLHPCVTNDCTVSGHENSCKGVT